MITNENYYSFPAINNSELTWFNDYFLNEQEKFDKQIAYDDGNLVDAIITEPVRVNLYTRTVQGINRVFTPEKIGMALQMKRAFCKDAFCKQLASVCNFQHITLKENFKIQYEGFEFETPAKCKWDLFAPCTDLGGDIKSTYATSYKQFIEACYYFDYPRSRAWYMDLENRTNDVIIGISKKTYEVFKVKIKKNDELYNLGKKQYQEIAFKYFTLFGDLNKIKKI